MSFFEIDDLTIRDGVFQALSGVIFNMAERERNCLIDPSGCGKKTTLKVMAGFVAPASGEVRQTGDLLLAHFLAAPIVAITLGALGSKYVSLPSQGFALKYDASIFYKPVYLQALFLGLVIACLSAIVAGLLGFVGVLALHHYPTRLKGVLPAFEITSVVLHWIFVGLALLIANTYMGFGGSTLGLFAAYVVVATHFAVSLTLIGIDGVNHPVPEMTVRSLGASPWRSRGLITLPLTAWSIAACLVSAFMMSFGTHEISLFLSTLKTITPTVAIYTALEWSPLDPMLTSITSRLVITVLVALLFLVLRFKIDQQMKRGG